MIIYKGERLKEMIKDKKSEIRSSTGSDKIYERDFVNDIREVYFNSEPKYVLIINGLHGTGKTFGILQAVEDLDNVLYICAQENDGTTADDYIELLKSSEEDHIIIDEYSLINDRYDLDCCLWMLVKSGKHLVITGTSSISFACSENDPLIHKTNRVNINIFTYEEFCRIYQKEYSKDSFSEFLKTGSVFKEYDITNFDKSTIIDNYVGYTGTTYEIAKAAIYKIIYLAAAIDPDITVTPFNFEKASDILERDHIITKIHNIADPAKYKIYMTEPSIAYHMAENFFDDKTAEEKAFGSYAAAFMSKHVRETDHLWYIDMEQETGSSVHVIINSDDHLAYLFYIQLQRSELFPYGDIFDKLEDILADIDIGGRYVVSGTDQEKSYVYNGDPIIFTSLEHSTIKNYRDFNENYERIKNTAVYT